VNIESSVSCGRYVDVSGGSASVYESVEAVYSHAGDSTELLSAVVGERRRPAGKGWVRKREGRVGLNYLSK
jgi:hypothetical protein